MTNSLQSVVTINKALAHPVRLRIAGMLRGGPLCVCQITALVELAPSTVSSHLGDLRRAGIVIERKEGRWVEYQLSGTGPHVGLLAAIWAALDAEPRLAADEKILRELRRIPLQELCQVDLDLTRLGRARLQRAVAAAAAIPTRPASR